MKCTLIQFNSGNNNNKFYTVELLDDGITVVVLYGRVGSNGTRHQYTGGESKYNSLLKSKRNKGYKDAMVEDGNSESAQQYNVIEKALNEISYKDDTARELIKTVSEKNVHKITDTSGVTFDAGDGLFKTPLGVIQRTGVKQAIVILTEIESMLPKFLRLREAEPDAIFIDNNTGRKRSANGKTIASKVFPSKELKEIFDKMLTLNEDYFVIIPNKVTNARELENLLFSQKAIDGQKATCDALLETLNLMDDLRKREADVDKDKRDESKPVFNVEVETVTDEATTNLIKGMFELTKNNAHDYCSNNSRVVRVYRISLNSQQEPFKECSNKIGNVKMLWHGTRTQNLLSIMSKGLLLPDDSPGAKSGSMFGKGLYFARQSTKSLGYCDGGYWSSSGNFSNTVYMFLASVSMGNSFTPTGATCGPPPAGFDSYWAMPGVSHILNDEIIVFKSGQVRLDYIVEIEK
jgi:predicted DNA-binding WGR domain protein